MADRDSTGGAPLIDRRRRRLIQAMGLAGLGAGTVGLWSGALRAAADGEPRRGGTLRVALPSVKTIDPLKVSSGGGIAAIQQVGEYLVWAEDDLSLRPVLATDWQAADGGRRWTFELRRGVRFHDGREMTSADVVATFRRLVDPDNPTAAASQLPFLRPEGVSADGDYRVVFELDQPVGRFPYYTQTYNAIILPADYDGDFAANPVGTGPFRLVDYTPQESVVFERNPDYWDAPRPYVDRVECDIYGAAQPQILALRGDEVDMMLLAGPVDAKPLFETAGVEVLTTPSAMTRQLTMRTDQPPFDDVRVRRAVALAIDRPTMVETLLGGRADLGNDHPVAPIYPEKVSVAQRERDVAEARRLLAEAGHADGFEIDLYTGRFVELPQYAVLAQQMLAEVGIRVKINVEPLNVYYGHWTEVPLGLTDWTARPTAGQILAAAFRGDAEWNAPHWRNDEFDRLLDEFEASTDEAERNDLATRLAQILHDEVPAVITYFPNALRPVRSRVRGVSAHMSNYLDLRGAWLAG
ncbi:ABC transporter substrate-binding protein [Arhodomonas aquaeolei]|uniref:ABC transporter substrate-binding protein n=1 Tax=Arhodomonas aquaeolei TaxID=2369 RepID=UPI002168998D|nr:ABC transporter substrate-binding protein [Arhodomonas aquaeolei]MCS4503143.1 ABC transporter substrate-binding protein [Arhodomonas aquaeolei]